MARAVLSKSKYLAGLQCFKLLWHHYNAKDRIPPPDAATQALFDLGHQVGQFARRLFPGGIEVAWDEYGRGLKQSGDYLKKRKPLFEGGARSGTPIAGWTCFSPRRTGKNPARPGGILLTGHAGDVRHCEGAWGAELMRVRREFTLRAQPWPPSILYSERGTSGSGPLLWICSSLSSAGSGAASLLPMGYDSRLSRTSCTASRRAPDWT